MSRIAFGHSDFWMSKDFGNVKVRITTGFHYEEINKSWIIGELAKRLCQKLNYTKPIFVDFSHYYVGNCEPDYFLSFDDGSILETWNTEKPKPFLKVHALVIREVSRQFNPSTTLKLLEYAVKNADKIKSSQKLIEYKENYCHWRIKTMDTGLVKNVANGITSNTVNTVLSTKVYRQNDQRQKTDMSYFYQNEKYHIFYREFEGRDSVLLVVENIYQLSVVSFDKVVVFDSDSSFYFVQGVNDPHRSQRKIIDRIDGNYYPIEVNKVGSKKVLFSFWEEAKSRERTVLFWSDTEELIQDLDNRLR